jgi:hypothetical protein
MRSTRLSPSPAIVRERANTGLEKPRCSFACMNSSTNTVTSLSANRNPPPSELSDAELLTATRSLVGRSNQLLAALLAHLGEVEARGIPRTRACSSLYIYCIYELRYSEDEAYRRVAAARLVRRFPALLDAIAAGELHLTGLLMLGPHLTEANISQVLLRAKHRTKKEIARLVRELDPLPEVPPRIEPLGPAPARLVPKAPTWEAFVSSLCPVRALSPGERPRDWMEDANESDGAAPAGFTLSDNEAVSTRAGADAPRQVPPAEPLSPQRYKVQFTASRRRRRCPLTRCRALPWTRSSFMRCAPSWPISGGGNMQ